MVASPVRTTVVFPADTVERLRELVPRRKRSEFVVKAVEQRLEEIHFQQVCEQAFGAWKDEDHPELQTQQDVRSYIREVRDPASWRRPAGKGR